jgi:C_GCAxxG_C_C family probable redox protein
MSLGSTIYALRTEKKMPQKTVAQYLNVSVSTVSNYEVDRHTPDIETLSKLADLFEVSVDYIIGRTDLRQANTNEKITKESGTQNEIVKEVVSIAVHNFNNGLNCAESVYDALLRSGALKAPKETLAMCTGFGGGVGLTGYICGALSAAVMANSAKYGRFSPHDSDDVKKELSSKYYRRYNKLVHDFARETGAVNCADLCKEFDDFNSKERKMHCTKLVRKAAALAYDTLCVPQDTAFKLKYGENLGRLE